MYNSDELWSVDLSESIIQGDITVLEDERKKGWNLNLPLSRYYYNGILKFPVMLAIQYNNILSTKYLIENGAKLDIDNEHAVLYGIEYASQDLIDLLVKHKANIKSANIRNRAYIILCKKERFELIQYIDQMGISLNPYGNSALLLAITSNRYDIIEKLIENGIDLNISVKTEYNALANPPLSHAVICCDEKMVDFLIQKGANPWSVNKKGERAYHIALELDKLELAQLLKQYEANTVYKQYDDNLEDELPKDYNNIVKRIGFNINTKEYGKIRFLDPADICTYTIGKEKMLLLSPGLQEYPDVKILWTNKSCTVAYYDSEQKEYGEFGTTFAEFICDIDKYVNGIFRNAYLKMKDV